MRVAMESCLADYLTLNTPGIPVLRLSYENLLRSRFRSFIRATWFVYTHVFRISFELLRLLPKEDDATERVSPYQSWQRSCLHKRYKLAATPPIFARYSRQGKRRVQTRGQGRAYIYVKEEI
jgi:hypothetical protein